MLHGEEHASEISTYLETQWVLEAEPVITWEKAIREQGAPFLPLPTAQTVPIHSGVMQGTSYRSTSDYRARAPSPPL